MILLAKFYCKQEKGGQEERQWAKGTLAETARNPRNFFSSFFFLIFVAVRAVIYFFPALSSLSCLLVGGKGVGGRRVGKGMPLRRGLVRFVSLLWLVFFFLSCDSPTSQVPGSRFFQTTSSTTTKPFELMNESSASDLSLSLSLSTNLGNNCSSPAYEHEESHLLASQALPPDVMSASSPPPSSSSPSSSSSSPPSPSSGSPPPPSYYASSYNWISEVRFLSFTLTLSFFLSFFHNHSYFLPLSHPLFFPFLIFFSLPPFSSSDDILVNPIRQRKPQRVPRISRK